MARHTSRDRLDRNIGRARQHASDTVHTGRNAIRGLRDEPAVRQDGQTLLRTNSGTATSRGHRAGAGLRSTTDALRNAFRGDEGWSEPGYDAGRYEPREYNGEQDSDSSGQQGRTNESWRRDK
jgi:hypothetical protein